MSLIIRKLLRSLWLCFCWGTLLIVVLAAVGGVVALYQINSHIRRYVLAELEEKFPELELDIGNVRLDEEKGITIHNLECSLPSSIGLPKRPILIIKELFLDCPVTIKTLYQNDIRVKKIILRQPIIRITRTSEGFFEELKRFQPYNKTSVKPIPVEIVGGTLIYEDKTKTQINPIKITGITATITPPENDHRTVLLTDLEQKIPLTAWKFSGNAAGDIFRQFLFEGSFDPSDKNWNISASCRQLDWTSEFLDYLSRSKPLSSKSDYQKSLESFQGRFDFGVSAASDSAAPLGFRFALEGTLSQGRLELYDIHRTLSEINTKFKITDDSVAVEKLSAIGEAARLVLSYSQDGLLERRSGNISAQLRGLAFDPHFVEALSPFLNDQTEYFLKRLDYAGTADLDAELVYQNSAWKPKSVFINFIDLMFSYKPVPYKVERLSGDLNLNESAQITFRVFTKQGEPIHAQIYGDYRNVFVDPAGQVRIVGAGVPIDDKLMNALSKEQRKVVSALHPTGKINAELFITLPPGDVPLEKKFEIGLEDVSVKYDKFPYPLNKVYGLLHLDDETWTFQNIIGSNGLAVVRCSGHLMPLSLPDARESTELVIDLEAEELPVDDRLIESLLNADQRELLAGLRIKGKVNLDGKIQYLSHDNSLSLQFRAVPQAGLSMYPTKFPYRIDNVQGEIFYKDGNVHSDLLTGNNQDTRFSTGLDCNFAHSGRWAFRLLPLTIDQLPANREIQDALPANLRGIVENLQIVKPVNLNGSIEFLKPSDESPLLTVWTLGVVLHQNSIQLSVPIENIFGEIRLAGYSEDEVFQLAGELNIDSVTVRGFQTTRLEGPFFYDGTSFQGENGQGLKRIYLGRQESKKLPSPPDIPALQKFRQLSWFQPAQPARPLTARLFDGYLLGGGLVDLQSNAFSYAVNMELKEADLAKIAREIEPRAQKIAGTLNCKNVYLHGSGSNLGAMGGKGKLELRNANIFEAPGMIRLLRELSIRETDPNAGVFSAADIDFEINGPQVDFKETFEGGAFLLQGDGILRLDTRNVDMTLKTRLGNKRTQIPIVSDIIGGAGDQFIQIKVQGPISDPTVMRVALPEIQKAIMQIQGDEHLPPPTAKHSGPSRFFQWKGPSF